jgi:hypothetical protein
MSHMSGRGSQEGELYAGYSCCCRLGWAHSGEVQASAVLRIRSNGAVSWQAADVEGIGA